MHRPNLILDISFSGKDFMNRQTLITAASAFVFGMSVTSLLRNSQQDNNMKLANEAIHTTSDVAKQCMDGYNKLNDYNSEIFKLAQSYQESKDAAEKAKIADSLVFKIKDFNLPVAK
jgi:hypothetical protein